MNWASWSDFWAMGGYGFYVWGSYSVTAVLMIGEAIAVWRRRRTTLDELAKAVQMKAGGDESAQ